MPTAPPRSPSTSTTTAAPPTAASTPATQTFTITVTAVNDAPSFTKGADQTVLEDPARRPSAAGPPRSAPDRPTSRARRSLRVTNNTNTGPVRRRPGDLSPNGTLTYTPAANANGTATSPSRTGQRRHRQRRRRYRPPQTFTITVNAVNDAPTIDGVASHAMLSGTNKTVGLSGISEGPANESGQTLNFSFASSNPSVATAALSGPYLEGSGSASMLIAAGAATCGSTTITVTVTDDGGTTNGGDNDTTTSFTVSTFHGHFLAPLKEGARNLVQKGQVVPVKIDFGCPDSMPRPDS